MPAASKAAPQISATWSQIAALRLQRQHLVDRLPADRLLDVVREHVGIQAQVMSLAELQLNARLGRWRGGARKELAAEADRIAAFLDRPLAVSIESPKTRD